MSDTRWVEWSDPADGEMPTVIVIHRMTVEDAIILQKRVAKKAHDYIYDNDEDALMDFITVHWAEIKSY